MSGYLRIWVRAPPSFTLTELYSTSTQCRISVSTVVEEFIVAKCRLVMTLKDPADGRIARAEIKQDQEESGQQKHQWTKQRVCSTYEESLESQALGTKARGCHIFSTSKSISSMRREKHHGLGWSKAHTGRSREIKSNRRCGWSKTNQSGKLSGQNWRNSLESHFYWGQCLIIPISCNLAKVETKRRHNP